MAFRQEQERELALDNHGFEGRSIEELWRDPQWHEYIFTGGTGSVLDFPDLTDATDSDDGLFMRPLTDDKVRAWASNGRPTIAEWEDALGSERLPWPERGRGNCTALYRDSQPTEIGYWGVTCDEQISARSCGSVIR
ncbi:MAG: hypothetical protein LBV60_02020 [Streptomyces sp.]|nr:hypothetical protein [Streptomyces sp.]